MKVHLPVPSRQYTVCGLAVIWSPVKGHIVESNVFLTYNWEGVTCKRCQKSNHPNANKVRRLAEIKGES